MAEDNPFQGLCEETTCSICLEYFKDPVIIDCGHIFCKACITEYCGKSGTDASCPQCRATVQQKNFRPNRQLATIVELAKKFSLHTKKGAETLGPVCERHQEPLKLFCQDDQTPICVVCDKAKEHRGHRVIPKEEAFEEYKVKGEAHLEFLKKEREAMCSSKQHGVTESQTLLEQIERERQKIMAEFKELHQFLEIQEQNVLSELKDLGDQIKDKRNSHIDQLSKKICAVDLLIKEMEKKLKQPTSEFLQGLGNLLQGCNKGNFVDPEAFTPELKEQVANTSKVHSVLETLISDFKANLTDSRSYIVPTLVLSEAHPFQHHVPPSFGAGPQFSSLRSGGLFGSEQQFPLWGSSHQIVKQFSCWSYIMGVERINSRSCSWKMKIKDATFWAAGVALESFRGGNMSQLTPEQGIWAVGKSNGNWYAFTSLGTHQLACPWSGSSIPACLLRHCNATTIRFSLNHKEDSLTFLNADDDSAIYTFHKASFSGQTVSSWFFVGR